MCDRRFEIVSSQPLLQINTFLPCSRLLRTPEGHRGQHQIAFTLQLSALTGARLVNAETLLYGILVVGEGGQGAFYSLDKT